MTARVFCGYMPGRDEFAQDFRQPETGHACAGQGGLVELVTGDSYFFSSLLDTYLVCVSVNEMSTP